MKIHKSFSTPILGLVGLLTIALLFTNLRQPAEIESKPALASPTVASLPSVTTPLPAARAGCQSSAQPMRFFYQPDPSMMTAGDKDRLLISGTVYASDSATPLSGALVEVWRADAERIDTSQPDIIFRGQFRTDSAGHYQFTTMKSDRPDTPYLNLRTSYGEYCSVLIQLHIVAESPLREALTKDIPSPAIRRVNAFSTRTHVTGPALHGPVDIVLPVSPLLSE